MSADARHGVQILVLAGASDAAATAADCLEQAGHTVFGQQAVSAEVQAVQRAVKAAAGDAGCDAIAVVGGTGLGPEDVVPGALRGLLTVQVTGYAHIAHLVAYRDEGVVALLDRPMAGFVGGTVVFTLPTDLDGVERVISEVVSPLLPTLVEQAREHGPDLAPALEEPPAEDAIVDAEVEDVDAPAPPPPAPRWQLGTNRVVSEAAHIGAPEDAPADAEVEEVTDIPDRGWKRAVYDLEGEILRGKSPDLPQFIEEFAPAMEVLHQAGEYAQLKLPNGNKVMLYGFPDLQRANAKVLLVGWGEPHGEVIALHRYPVQAGLCIDEARGIMPGRSANLAEVSEAITGRPPQDTSGELYAVDHDAIYIQRGNKVYRWDGRRERLEGNVKQALSTLLTTWHQQ